MRTSVVLAVILAGCSNLLGISNPVAGRDGGIDAVPGDGHPGGRDGAPDVAQDAAGDSGSIDGPCVAPPSFSSPEIYQLSGTPGLVALGDFDGDGNQDVAIALTSKVLILHGMASGTLGRPQDVATAADGVLTDDFDNDGLADLALWTVGGSAVVVRRQDAANRGMFLDEQPLPNTFGNIRQVKQGLLDGNFIADLIVEDDAELRVYTSNQLTKGTFTKGGQIGLAGDHLLQVDDFNDLGGDDIALVTASGSIAIAPQTNGHFDPPGQIVTATAGAVAAFGRFDDDDAIDLVVATVAGGEVYRQSAPGNVPAFARVAGTIAGVTGSALQVVDVDQNGLDDVVVAGGIVQQCSPGVFSALVPLSAARTTVFRDLDRNSKPEMLRIVDRTLEVYRQ